MARRIVKEVTHPVHGPGGEVLYAPGDQFAEDRELPPDVPWRLVIAEVPDEPEAKPAPARPAAKPASGKGT